MNFTWQKKIWLLFSIMLICSNICAKNFTQELWKENDSFYQKIFKLPFNQELLNASLNEKTFKNYLIQDYLFLENFRKVYGILLAKAPDKNSSKVISNLLREIDEEINDVHTQFFHKFNITEKELNKAIIYPSTEFYNSFLIKTAVLEPFEVGLIATLPCHWVYYQIGIDMKKTKQLKDNKYQIWIYQYGAIPWEKSDTKTFVDLNEYYFRTTTPQTREKMRQAFTTAMQLEYMFWDGVYKNIQWPNGVKS